VSVLAITITIVSLDDEHQHGIVDFTPAGRFMASGETENGREPTPWPEMPLIHPFVRALFPSEY
jgi:hypothetical protein